MLAVHTMEPGFHSCTRAEPGVLQVRRDQGQCLELAHLVGDPISKHEMDNTEIISWPLCMGVGSRVRTCAHKREREREI